MITVNGQTVFSTSAACDDSAVVPMLLAALTATAWLATENFESTRLRSIPPAVFGSLAAAVVVSITGAIAALGDTLFPAVSLAAGMQQEFSATSATLLRLRVLHPAIAILGTAYVIWNAISVLNRSQTAVARRPAMRVVVLAVLQVVVGGVNLGLLAPVWMQLSHLFVADVLWIALVLLALETASVTHGEPIRDRRDQEATAQPQLRAGRV